VKKTWVDYVLGRDGRGAQHAQYWLLSCWAPKRRVKDSVSDVGSCKENAYV